MPAEIIQGETQLAVGHHVQQFHLVRIEGAIGKRALAFEGNERQLFGTFRDRQVYETTAVSHGGPDDRRRFSVESVMATRGRVASRGASERVVVIRAAKREREETPDVQRAMSLVL